jgi:adenine/guanine phosphoribosyltransferase-like PRPP-binding protein
MTDFWQEFEAPGDTAGPFGTTYPAPMPDGSVLRLPLRDFGQTAVAGLIANQASFRVLDRIAGWVAERARVFRPDVVVGLPTLGHVVGAATARALGHPNWVAPGTSRKLWYDDGLSVPLASITSPQPGRRMWLDPRLLPLLAGRRVLLVDDVISTGSSAAAGIALLAAAGIEPVALAVAMIQGNRWRATWRSRLPVIGAFHPALPPHRTGLGGPPGNLPRCLVRST